MVKLTAELVYDSRQYINAVKDRELCLRGWKIPAIENLGVTNNQFDTIDLTDNALKRLENFPLLPRLRSLLLSNNSISQLQADLGKYLPNLRELVLLNNNIQELGDLHPLASFQQLEYVTLLGNPVSKNKIYRMYVIYKIPKIRVLDFRRIKDKERHAAREMFKGARGKALRADVVKFTGRTFTPGEMAQQNGAAMARAPVNGVQEETPDESKAAADLQQIRMAISAAGSLQEVEMLGDMLSQGQVPKTKPGTSAEENMEPDVVEEVEMVGGGVGN